MTSPSDLAREALKDDAVVTPGPWMTHVWDNGSGESWEIAYCGLGNLKLQGIDPTPFICSQCMPPRGDIDWIARARTREAALARAVLEMEERIKSLEKERST